MSRVRSLGCIAGSLALVAIAGACDRTDKTPPPPAEAPAPPPPAQPGPPFKAEFTTTKGKFVVEVTPELSPLGAERFRTLIDSGYFQDIAFFRVLPGFVAQFGMHGDPAVNERWRSRTIMDEPVKTPNVRGTIVFAKPAYPNSRSNQFFINLDDNSGSLDPQGFSPFGKVIEGMDVVDKIYQGYGQSPDQGAIGAQGNAYLKQNFPKLDYIKSARIIE